MYVKPVTDPAFSEFGVVVTGFDFTELLQTLTRHTEKPEMGIVYEPSDVQLEGLPVATQLCNDIYGGMPVQIGYCNGSNRALNCLEYHRGSEVNIAADEIVLLLAPLKKVVNNSLDTVQVEAFRVPAGTAVLLYETTLHYAPCDGSGENGFRVAVVLPRGTNTEKPETMSANRLLWARNKWLLAHPESPEAAQGAFVGLTGPNITIK